MTVVGPTGGNAIYKKDIPKLFPCPAVKVTESIDNKKKSWKIETEQVVVECGVVNEDLTLSWYLKTQHQDYLIAQDLPFRAYAYEKNKGVYHYMKKPSPNAAQGSKVEYYYGGEKASPLDLSGRRFRLDAVDALGYDPEKSDPLYKVTPFHVTVGWDPLQQVTSAYGLYYDHLSSGCMDFGCEIDAFYGPYKYYYSSEATYLDYYFIAGGLVDWSTYDQEPVVGKVLHGYADIIGKPALPPRYSLGYLASAMGYAESDNAQEILETFPKMCQEHDIPCDVLHLSSGYTVDPSNGARNVFQWNKKRFPHPDRLFALFAESGIRVSANVKPWLLEVHPDYDQVDKNRGFVLQDKTRSSKTRLWSAGEGETGEGSYFDFSSQAGYDYWTKGVKELLKVGIESIWNDNNEFALPDDDELYVLERTHHTLQQTHKTVGEMGRSFQTLLMAHASYQAMLEYAPTKRPFLITRSSCPGVQRYASQTWSGDNLTGWKTLQHNIPMGLNAGLALFPMGYGHDVGGFVGERPSPELFVRWIQNGIFMARFCIHSWKKEGVTEPWMYPQMLPFIRQAIHLRYQLVPYLYQLAHECHQMGYPIIRPLFFHYPFDHTTFTCSFEFLLGPFMLIASVYEPQAIQKTLYLPSSHDWCCFWTGQWYKGGQSVVVDVPISQCGAVFIKAGALIPMSLQQERHVWLYPPPDSSHHSRYTLIEDDGISLDGPQTVIQLEMQSTPSTVFIGYQVVQKEYALAFHSITFVLPPGDTRQLQATVDCTLTQYQGRSATVMPIK